MQSTRWLHWVQSLQALAQSGLTYSQNPFDIERYEAIRAIAAEIGAEYSQVEFSVVENLFKAQEGYTTPKLDVRGVVAQNGKVLLVRELLDDGRWTLPGGWADIHESPSRAVEREVWEESGYEVKATKLLAVLDRDSHPHTPAPFDAWKLVFLCTVVGGKASTSIETGEGIFFAREEIHDLSLARITPDEIDLVFQHLQNPESPTTFD